MFPQQPQQQFSKAGSDVQLFYSSSSWTKPPGVSHVYMMLIGGGGDGDGSSGGGSGAVTVWYGAAQHVPNNLVVSVSTGDSSNTTVNYRASSGLIALLTANGAVTINIAAAMVANQFAASGFFKSTAGQNGSTTSQTASATTFLSGGAANATVTSNYGYSTPAGNNNGFFMLQPIIVGLGASGGGRGGIGCGGGYAGPKGGPGMVLIASW